MAGAHAAADGASARRAGFDPARDLPGYDVARAKRYGRVRLGVIAAATASALVRPAVFALSGASARLRQRWTPIAPTPRTADAAFLGAYTIASWLARLPLAYLGGHRVERAFGLTRQSTGGWLADEAKGLVLSLSLQVPLTASAYAVIRRRPADWWLILAGAAVPLTVVAGRLAPVLIMPLFNRFERLDDPHLSARIIALAERAGVSIADVYRVDMSRQTEKANAFFAGLGASKRIVLGDTLLAKFTPEEIEGVVAHELGHQVHGDIWRSVALGSCFGLAGSYLLFRVGPPAVARTSRRTGVSALGDIASLPLLELVLTATGVVAGPLQAAVSRAIERRTDRYALALTGNVEAYAAAMGRLATQNLADPDPPRVVVALLYGHPPIAERISTARAFRPRPEGTDNG